MRSKDHSLKAPKASHQISLGVGITAYVQNTVAGHGAKQICSMVFQPPKRNDVAKCLSQRALGRKDKMEEVG